MEGLAALPNSRSGALTEHFSRAVPTVDPSVATEGLGGGHSQNMLSGVEFLAFPPDQNLFINIKKKH